MSLDFNANQYRDVYPDLGVDLDTLGCIMLDTAEPALTGVFDQDGDLASDLRAAEHITTHPERFWIKGLVGASETSHVTLLYGLLPGVSRAQVDRVLDGWTKPDHLTVEHVGIFPSPYDDEPYACIVAHLAMGSALREAHARLSMLPHLDTFPTYRAHVTLAYVDAEPAQLDDLVLGLDLELRGKGLPTGNLNYGKSIG